MEIIRKISQKSADLRGQPVPVIAFLGDSVTQGCFEVYFKENGEIETVYDEVNGYVSCVSTILKTLFPNVPVAIVNAGISGDNAVNGALRTARDVLRVKPDLTVVCFGLNDCNNGKEGIGAYCKGLRDIFSQLKEAGSEVIFMTPNMMNTRVSCHIQEPGITEIAEGTGKLQRDGMLDMYVAEGLKVAEECNVTVCDVYRKWKLLAASGVDTTELLANYINHPTRKMSWLMAWSLVETMLEK